MPDRELPAGEVDKPRADVVRSVLAALNDGGITAAVGGSGLLAALGLAARVRDWDITTDADPQAVRDALTAHHLGYTLQPSGDPPFATACRLRVDGGDHEVDVIVGFALRDGDEIVALPTRVTGSWCGLPLGDPSVWVVAYRLMARPHVADLLDAWLTARAHADPGDRHR